MNLKFGVVSLFGLLNNKDKDIKVYIDKELLNEDIITFHPNDNTATIWIKVNDLIKMIDLFLTTDFKNEERHVRRNKQINDYEMENN